MKIKRGHLYSADLNPRFGTEAGKIRPVLVIQTDLLNTTSHPSTVVCLLTTKVRPGSEILRVHLKKKEAGLDKDSDVMIDQIRAIDNRRFKKEIGKLPSWQFEEIEENLRIVLDLS